ncbi:DNA polymerase IV [Nakamurella sp. GG22]
MWVLHVDMDQFIAAVELLRHPELDGLPVVVGGAGDPTQRSVVATASYAAREFGVRSGMPMRTALKKCPDAVFLPADNPAYEEASAQVQAVLRSFDVVVEVLGWDEAFLGADTRDPEALARQIQAAVLTETALHCSIGVGDNTLRAKLATEFAKPAGVFRLTAATWEEVMFDRPTAALWGIGGKTARKLAELGVRTVRDLAGADPTVLAGRFGPNIGPWLVSLGRGEGRRTVNGEPWIARSHSRETTFQQDLTQWSDVRDAVAGLVRRLHDDVVADGRGVGRVAVKVRFAPFFTSTRSATLPAPTSAVEDLESAALLVLERFEHDRAIRLLGVRAEFVAGASDGQQPPQRDDPENDDARPQRDGRQAATVVRADEAPDQ